MSQVRAKFVCSHFVQHRGYAGKKGCTEYHFDAVCADEVPENRRYHEATPSGKLLITVTNHAVSFEPGKNYYLDFTEVE